MFAFLFQCEREALERVLPFRGCHSGLHRRPAHAQETPEGDESLQCKWWPWPQMIQIHC